LAWSPIENHGRFVIVDHLNIFLCQYIKTMHLLELPGPKVSHSNYRDK